MNTQHKEIIAILEKIPALYKEFSNFEKNLAGKENIKNKMSHDAYLTTILNYEDKERNSKHIKQKLMVTGNALETSQPDFMPSYESKEILQKYKDVVGRVGVSERIHLQMKLLELMELKESFKTLGDLLNKNKVKRLETYFKGRK